MRTASICFLPVVLFLLASSSADDWPQWLGPNRDGVWREQGIVEDFPEDGLTVRWRAPVALGYAGPAVVGDRVFVMDYVKQSGKIANNPGGRDRLEGSERVLCLDADKGTLLWKFEYERPYQISYGGGPRCTPTVDSGKVYALGAEGNLSCLDAEEGGLLWNKDFVKEYGAKVPIWGCAAHPLVDGDLLYCVVGGPGSVAVAFEKQTGREVWRALSAAEPGYCPPTMIEHAGKKQLLIWHAQSLNSLEPQTGKLLWSVPLKPAYGMAIAAPKKTGPYLFASSHGNVGALLKLNETGSEAQIVWRGDPKTAVYCANSTPVLEDGMIYGCDINTGMLMGVHMESAQRRWQTLQPTIGGTRRGRYGTAFLVKHQDRYFLFSETGDLILARLSPRAYEELDRFHVLDPTNQTFGRPVLWSHPAFANRSVYARNDKELVCVSLAAD